MDIDIREFFSKSLDKNKALAAELMKNPSNNVDRAATVGAAAVTLANQIAEDALVEYHKQLMAYLDERFGPANN